MDPNQHEQVGLEIKVNVIDGVIKIDAQLVNEGVVFLKFKGAFK
jgi:3-hydroxyacyl-[acyl-carrier-protein] dehydratase